jgi:D-glycero-alpha-D-manno-heptose 1-phosphate guanylyltransferase
MTVAVILAGGLGTRLRSVVPDLPKPMAMISGRPFLEYLMNYWVAQGVKKFILSVAYKRELIIQHFGNLFQEIPVKYVEESEPLGTGGGVLLASQHLTEPFLLLNGDTFFKVSLSKLVQFHEQVSSDWTISLFRAEEGDRYGGFEIETNGKVQALKSEKSTIGELSNGGVCFVHPDALHQSGFKLGIKHSLEDEIIPKLIADKRKFYGIEFKTQFLDIGVPKDYLKAQSILVR